MKAVEFFRPIADVADGSLPPPIVHYVIVKLGHALIYGFGGHGKGVIAAWVIAQMTKAGVNVGVLDYEDNPDEWRSRVEKFGGDLARLFIASPTPEGALKGPIWEQAEEIRGFVRDLDIGFVVVDSVTIAAQVTGEQIGDPDPPQNYHKAMKRICASSLSIGHVSGYMKRESLAKPWGSHFWRNAFRLNWSVWHDRAAQVVEVELKKTNRYRERSYRVAWPWADELPDGETPPDLDWEEVDLAQAPGTAGKTAAKANFLEEMMVKAGSEIASHKSATPKKFFEWIAANVPEGMRGNTAQQYGALVSASKRDPMLDRLVADDTGKTTPRGDSIYVYRFAPGEADDA